MVYHHPVEGIRGYFSRKALFHQIVVFFPGHPSIYTEFREILRDIYVSIIQLTEYIRDRVFSRQNDRSILRHFPMGGQ